MRELLDEASGERLEGDRYSQQFDKDFWNVGEPGFWKLERRQTFRQPRSESWVAFDKGDWAEALRLSEIRRPSLEDYYRKIADHGFSTWWVRVAEKPITPYLQWEFNSYLLRRQYGDKIRVVGVDQVEPFEHGSLLPEIITLGREVMYELLYDESGLQEGGIRFTDRELILRWQEFIRDLYATGEEVESYFHREVANLEPPNRE
jgi:hypothetical protein